MSFIDLSASLEKAGQRLGITSSPPLGRRRRADRGRSRLPEPVIAKLTQLFSTYDRTPMRELQAELKVFCQTHGHPVPARATLYNAMTQVAPPLYDTRVLPPAVREALYNLDLETPVPGHQIAFYCFNYGSLTALSFAAGLPWLSLYQAAKMRGFRSKSRGLLEAVLRARRI